MNLIFSWRDCKREHRRNIKRTFRLRRIYLDPTPCLEWWKDHQSPGRNPTGTILEVDDRIVLVYVFDHKL